MARRGENIRKRKDGRWEGRHKVYHAVKERYVYHSVYGYSYAEVKEKLAIAKLTHQNNLSLKGAEMTSGTGSADTVVLFSDAAAEWLEIKWEKCKYSTYIKYETVYRTHLSALLGDFYLSNANFKSFQEKIFDHLSSGCFSESLQKSICCVVNQILRHVGEKYGLRLPVLKRPDTKQRKKTLETFTASERQRMFSVIREKGAESDKYDAALVLCLYTGVRIGELCALRWSDLDFREMTLSVNRTVQRIAARNSCVDKTGNPCAEGQKGNPCVEGQARNSHADQSGTQKTCPYKKQGAKTVLLETEPKSESSRRKIPIPAEGEGLFSRLDRSRPYVFGGDKPMEPRTLQYRFKKILAAAKVDERSFHMLRHTFATSCIECGMDVKSLSEILGHSDVKITMNRYVHPTMDSKRKQMGVLSDFYGNVWGQICGHTV